MNVYKLDADVDRYQILVLKHGEVWHQWRDRWDGTPFGKSWKPVEVEVFREDGDQQDRPPSDTSGLSPEFPVFSQHAVESLYDVLKDNGEILPLICSDGSYFAFNVTTIIDALDEEISLCDRFKSSGRIMQILTYQLFEDKLHGATIFKLPQVRRGAPYVTDEFLQRVADAGLTGFLFRHAWRSSPAAADRGGVVRFRPRSTGL